MAAKANAWSWDEPEVESESVQLPKHFGTHTPFQISVVMCGSSLLKHNTIVMMKEYEHFSLEEIRLQDYLQSGQAGSVVLNQWIGGGTGKAATDTVQKNSWTCGGKSWRDSTPSLHAEQPTTPQKTQRRGLGEKKGEGEGRGVEKKSTRGEKPTDGSRATQEKAAAPSPRRGLRKGIDGPKKAAAVRIDSPKKATAVRKVPDAQSEARSEPRWSLPVCAAFLQGKCTPFDDCNSYHPGEGFSFEDSTGKKEPTVRPTADSSCKAHPSEPADFVCVDRDCQAAGQPICGLCTAHEGHQTKSVEQFVAEQRQKLQAAMDSTQQRADLGEQVLSHFRATRELIVGQTDKQHHRFDQLFAELQAARSQIASSTDVEIQNKLWTMDRQAERLADFVAMSHHALRGAATTLSSCDDRGFLLSYQEQHRLLLQLAAKQVRPTVLVSPDVRPDCSLLTSCVQGFALLGIRPQSNDFDSTLYDAACDSARLKRLLTTRWPLIDLPNPLQSNRTPLHQAAACGNVPALDTLIRAGSGAIDEPDSAGMTPLHLAAAGGHSGAIGYLVQAGSAAIDAPNRKGQIPMHLAAENGHRLVIDLLVGLGSTGVDRPDSENKTPLLCAAQHGHASTVELLVRFGSLAIDTPDNVGSPMQHAAQRGHTAVVSALVQSGSQELSSDRLPELIRCAVREGQAAIIEQLLQLDQKAARFVNELDQDGQCSAVHLAAANGHAETIALLVRLGSGATCAPNNSGLTPMHLAAARGHAGAVEALARLAPRSLDLLDNDGASPLLLAAKNGSVDVIESLLQLGSKAIDTPNNDGATPLLLAAQQGHSETIKALVRLGSQAVDTQNKEGTTPLAAAALVGSVGIIETLLRLGSSSIDSLDLKGQTPLHSAAQHGHEDVIEALVCLGTQSLNKPDTNGKTPLLLAAHAGHSKAVEALVRLGSRM